MGKTAAQLFAKEKIRKAKNPGKLNRDARKSGRGATFVGVRPAVFKNKKAYDRKRGRNCKNDFLA